MAGDAVAALAATPRIGSKFSSANMRTHRDSERPPGPAEAHAHTQIFGVRACARSDVEESVQDTAPPKKSTIV